MIVSGKCRFLYCVVSIKNIKSIINGNINVDVLFVNIC